MRDEFWAKMENNLNRIITAGITEIGEKLPRAHSIPKPQKTTYYARR